MRQHHTTFQEFVDVTCGASEEESGTVRFCVDYCNPNNVTKKDVHPLSQIDDILDRLQHPRYFSSMDLKTGYWRIEVDERDRANTALITPEGLLNSR